MRLGERRVLPLCRRIRLRLLRILKVFRFLDKYKASNIWKIFRLFAGFGMFAHWIGCFWWYVGINWKDEPPLCDPDAGDTCSWIQGQSLESCADPDAADCNKTRMFQYVRSLYWALTTITSVGYGDITRVTYDETSTSRVSGGGVVVL